MNQNQNQQLTALAQQVGYDTSEFPQQARLNQLLREKSLFDHRQYCQQKDAILDHLDRQYQQTPEHIVRAYIDQVNQLCQLTGFGHHFDYSHPPDGCQYATRPPPQWLVKPSDYSRALPTPDQVLAIQLYSIDHPDFKCSIHATPCNLYYNGH